MLNIKTAYNIYYDNVPLMLPVDGVTSNIGLINVMVYLILARWCANIFLLYIRIEILAKVPGKGGIKTN